MNLTLALILGACAITATGLLIYQHATRLTPEQQVFQDAHDLIQTHGLYQGGFTPRGKYGIGEPIPHCILAAVKASSNSTCVSIYVTPECQFLRQFSYDRLGMYPEDVNDKTDKATVLHLLLEARDAV